jgi:hypothetical protein
MTQYPSLYSIVSHKNVTVAEILYQQPLNIGFKRELSGDRWIAWLQLVESLMEVNLTDDSDSFIWHLTESGVFSVKSLYTDLMNGHTRFLHKYLWKIKVPPKIKIFMWFLHKKILLTKDNLAKGIGMDVKMCFLRFKGVY